MKYTIGIDIGGTNSRVALVDGFSIIDKRIFNTIKDDPKRNLQMIVDFINEKLEQKIIIERIGVSLPGVNNKQKGFMGASTNLPAWANFNVCDFLKSHVSKNTILYCFTNDVNALAWGHYLFQSNCHANVLLTFTVSTGLGGGMVYDGRIFEGAFNNAIEVANLFTNVEYQTSSSTLNKGACEAAVSGNGILHLASQLGLTISSSKELYDLFQKNDKRAMQIVDIQIDNLARMLQAAVLFVDPQVIVLCGPIILQNKWLMEKIEQRLQNYLMPNVELNAKLVISEMPSEIGLIGAANL